MVGNKRERERERERERRGLGKGGVLYKYIIKYPFQWIFVNFESLFVRIILITGIEHKP